MKSFDEINELTGFANGQEFSNEKEVRDYFTIENIVDMGLLHSREEESERSVVKKVAALAQENLTRMAEQVLREKWHCNF
jgi:hypothetical protein